MYDNDVVAFWGGPLSQWDSSPFTIDGIVYGCAEQYMMSEKALLFGDRETRLLIMMTSDPREQKRLGRKVKGFKDEVWRSAARDIVFNGNMAKYTQNVYHRSYLLNTRPRMIVEASPHDRLWGVGLHPTDIRVKDPSQWMGLNWLGETLEKVRDALQASGHFFTE